ncbi:hypothetical protein Pyn_12066 [Prunus yedoensis var. nudiflora]|uniref:Uncharacterized protein n=1 Tax=Prunus yedoensis var. nudiflora TaxID=2094558 RepID=A0A314ZFJ2_PRUYE|nr:hypothetical protein Pyn_12066 [Prunus yedoensis var. nudiflora]
MGAEVNVNGILVILGGSSSEAEKLSEGQNVEKRRKEQRNSLPNSSKQKHTAHRETERGRWKGGLPELPLPDGPREIEIGWAFRGFGGLLFTHTTDHALVALT